MNNEFDSAIDLYNRVLPALKIRRKTLKKQNIHMSEEEIWNYFKLEWMNEVNLTLYKIVDNVLNKEIKLYEDNLI